MKFSRHSTPALVFATVLSTVTASIGAEMDMIVDFPGLLRLRANKNSNTNVAAASSTNLFAFSSALGNAAAQPVTSTGDSQRLFEVGTDTFTDFATAAQKSCNNQHNACANVANKGSNSGLTVGQCDGQQTQCLAAAANGPSNSNSNSSSSSTSTSTTSTSTSTTSTSTSTSANVASAAVQQSSNVASVVSVASVPSVVSVASTTTSAFQVQGTLHSSDENFLFFCD